MTNSLPHKNKSDDELRRIIVCQGKITEKLRKDMRAMRIQMENLKDENETCRKQLKSPEKSIIWYREQPGDDY